MRLESDDPWMVLFYEIKMYGLTKRQIGTLGSPSNDTELVIKNALVESSLLHTRILVDTILSRGKMKDDIGLRHLIPKTDISNQLSDALAKLKIAWGDSKKKGSPCWTLNKMLAHPTLWRSASYDYGTLANRVDPHIYAAIKEIASISNRHDFLTFL